VGEGLTPGVAEWEPLHLDYVQGVVLGPLPSTVADLSQRVTELEHTGEIVPPDYALTVDLYGGSFTRIIGADVITGTPKRITVSLAVSPGPGGAVFASLADISGTGAVWADFAGTIGKVVDSSGTGINGASLKEAIRRGQIVTVHRGTDGTHPTLVVEKVEDPADAGSSLTLDALKDVDAPASTPAGMFLGTVGVGAWGPVANPTAGVWPGKTRTSRPNSTDRLVEVWDGAAWVPIHYDSGWRNMQSAFAPVNCTLTYAHLIRVGSLVTLNFALQVTTANQQVTIGALPAGFAPVDNFDVAIVHGEGMYFCSLQVRSGTVSLWKETPIPVNTAWRQNMSWRTAPATPSSLPGTTRTTAP
jgi:hypothetical protein